EDAYKNVLEFANTHHIPFAFSPGSHQLHDMNDTFFKALKECDMIFINKTEAEVILKKMGKSTSTIPELLTSLQEIGISIVSITDGHNGSYCIDENKQQHKVPAFSDTHEFVEKTGAGDAYASGFLAEYLLNHNISDAMRWGGLNALSVMEHIG